MATDTFMNEQIYPCKAASREELDGMLRGRSRDYRQLKDYLYTAEPERIRWEKVLHLRIIGSKFYDCNELQEAEIVPGRHCSADGTWVLMLLPEQADPDSAMDLPPVDRR